MAETQTANNSQFYTGYTTGTRLSGPAERGLGPVAVFDVEGDSLSGSPSVDLWNNTFRELFEEYHLSVRDDRWERYAINFLVGYDPDAEIARATNALIVVLDRHDISIKALFDLVKALAMRINEMERKPQNVMEEWMFATGGKR